MTTTTNNKRKKRVSIIDRLFAMFMVLGAIGGVMFLVTSTMHLVSNYKSKTPSKVEQTTDTAVEVQEQEYTLKGKVIYTEGERFTIATTDGNEWECCAEGFSVNDVVEVTFNNNCTLNVYDDSITHLTNLSHQLCASG